MLTQEDVPTIVNNSALGKILAPHAHAAQTAGMVNVDALIEWILTKQYENEVPNPMISEVPTEHSRDVLVPSEPIHDESPMPKKVWDWDRRGSCLVVEVKCGGAFKVIACAHWTC